MVLIPLIAIGEHTNFVAPGYKVVEEDGIFTVVAE